jgi:hypothetical protein
MRKALASALVVASAVSLLVSGCGGAAQPATTAPAPTTQTSDSQTPPATAPGTQTPAPTTPAPQPEPPKPAPEPPKPVPKDAPNPTRGIMVSGWYAGSPDLLGPLLQWAKDAGMNTLVLDIKAEDGKISWVSDVPLAKEIGSNERKIGDINKVIQQMHDMGFWVAGRIVTMNDQYLYKSRPDWGIPGFSGGPYSFMDPKSEGVFQYNLDIAKAAVKAGVDEVQFDYIRYPDKLINGYNKDTGADYRTGNIDTFLQKAVDELHPLGVKVSADVFGLTTSVAQGDDMQIGQDYQKIAAIVDYICAMAYPSHYAPGTYGLDDPNKHPYETVKNSLGKALERTPGIPVEKHRPWIQDFTLGGVHYGTAEVSAQIKALHDIGIKSFVLWDPTNKYSRGVDYSQIP